MEEQTETTGEVTFVQKENDRRQGQRPPQRGDFNNMRFGPGIEGYAELVEAMRMAKCCADNKEKGR